MLHLFLTILLFVTPLLSAQSPGPLVLPAQQEGLRFVLFPDQTRPGDPLTVAVSGAGIEDRGDLRVVLTVGETRLSRASFFPLNANTVGDNTGKPLCMAAILGIPSTAKAGPALLLVESGGAILWEIPLTIGSREFAAEEIALNPVNTGIRIDPDPQKTTESDQLWVILNRTNRDIYSSGPFVPPVTSTRRTSYFGDRRVYVYSNGGRDTSIHAGVDYGVPTGTAVTACAAGKVVLARSRIVTGNSVVIEHLPGVYSLYYHLDSIAVTEGQMLKPGEQLGKSGATGLATGPHLHWEIRVSGENTDPDAFVGRSILDKDAILSKIEL